MIIRRISLPLLVALALAGCANGDTGDSAGDAAQPASAAPSATTVAPSLVPQKPPSAGGTETISGTITAGVEPNCLLLQDRLLIINDSKLQPVAKVGATVTVTGHAEQGMMTTCQQGTPFLVTAIRAN